MKGKIILIATFIVVLMLPSILMFTNWEESYKGVENRKLTEVNFRTLKEAKRSVINLKNFYKDNFGTRFFLYNFYKKNISERFNESPSNSKILLGQNGWLFLGDSFNNAFSKSKGNLVFKNEELVVIKENLSIIKDWCKKNKTEIFINAVPGKHTVYKENLPYKINEQRTQLDQFKQIYPELIDLRDLFEVKKEKQLYFKTDSHWNQFGAFEAYLKVMQEFKTRNSGIKMLTPKNIDSIVYINSRIGDLNVILDRTAREKEPKMFLKNSLGKSVSKKIEVPFYHRLNKESYEERYVNDLALNDMKIVLLRDSFSDFSKDFFRATFSEVVFVYNHQFDRTILLNEKPDIILYEIGERFIDRFLKIFDLSK